MRTGAPNSNQENDMGTFKERSEAVAAAKSNLFSEWFVLIQWSDGTWDYAQPGRPMPASDRAEQFMYQRSRSSGNWYIKRD
jgi:hypothetical protein